jgi:hypothetical protein
MSWQKSSLSSLKRAYRRLPQRILSSRTLLTSSTEILPLAHAHKANTLALPVPFEARSSRGSGGFSRTNSRAVVTNQCESPGNGLWPAGALLFNRATSYSPTHSRVQYHRGCRA